MPPENLAQLRVSYLISAFISHDNEEAAVVADRPVLNQNTDPVVNFYPNHLSSFNFQISLLIENIFIPL